jgi:TolA-binding protein
MKTAKILGLIAVLICLQPEPALAQTTAGVKDMLGNLWARLRAATPRSTSAAPTVTVTAGLRGNEATESELKPYWRGDREQDPSSKNERLALENAQALADAGKFPEAARAYDAFLEANPRSTLASNAVFGAALARAAMGERARASAGFEDFLKREPQHPLADDARQALAALR